MANDDANAFLQKHVARAIEKNRMTPSGGNYLLSLMDKMPELREVALKAKSQIGDQDPERFTQYQQQQFGEILGMRSSEILAKKMGKGLEEQQTMQRYAEHGEPTGENYWVEGGDGMVSLDVPPELKDDIHEEMKKERRSPNGPATELEGFVPPK